MTSVSNGPGNIALTRTDGANASAYPVVKALSPAFAQAYGSSFGLAISDPTVPTLMMRVGESFARKANDYDAWRARTAERLRRMRA